MMDDKFRLPEDYVVQYFNQYVGYPKYKSSSNIYYGGCPFCHEDKSWGKKSRFFYLPKKELVFCHNCGYSKRPLNFVKDVSGLEYSEIMEEISEFDILPEDIGIDTKITNFTPKSNNDNILPEDPINLLDEPQIKYFKENKIVKLALAYIHSRRLDTAINRPISYYISLTDRVHKNRLILPFMDDEDNLKYYQSRKLLNDDSPSYLSKVNGDRILPNLNNVDTTIPYIFIFEGPIDSYFCKNSTAVSGIQKDSNILFSTIQKKQLEKFYLFDNIWVLDSQWKDKTSFIKTKRLVEMGERVFIWPRKYGMKFKDFNEMAIKMKLNEIPYKWVKNNAITKVKALLVLSQIESLIYNH